MSNPMQVASWWARDYAYATNWQLRALFSPRDSDRYREGVRRPVVVIPGIWETWGFLRPLIDALHAAGHPVHVVRSLGRNGKPVDEGARIVADLLAQRDLRDVAIVAHSKGGLIGKYLMTDLDPEKRVDRMVAVCTPFAGSIYARFMLAPSLRAFAPNDPTTVRLQSTLDVNARITAISGVFDPHIPGLWTLEGAHNVTIETGGHFRPLSDPRTLKVVLDVVGGPADQPTLPAEGPVAEGQPAEAALTEGQPAQAAPTEGQPAEAASTEAPAEGPPAVS